MDEQLAFLFVFVEKGSILVPLLFILLHLLRPLFFLPVAVICTAGGILFGTAAGTAYSLIGLLLSSFQFYVFINNMPKTNRKLSQLKSKWFGDSRNFTVGQIAVLRLIPFIHYHLLSFCLLQKNKSLLSFMKASLYANVPLAFFYTIFGEYINTFSPSMILLILLLLTILVYFLRDKGAVIKWREFF